MPQQSPKHACARSTGNHQQAAVPKETPSKQIEVPLRVYRGSMNPLKIDDALMAQLSKALERRWGTIEKVYPGAENKLELVLINTPHKSRGYSEHSTLKLVYDSKNGKRVAGTMHVPGRNGKAADLWPGAGKKWTTKDIDTDFLLWRVVKCKIARTTGRMSQLAV